MKKTRLLISVIALALALVCSVMPLAKFGISADAIDDVRARVAKQEAKLADEQASYDKLVAEGADSKKLEKQKGKVDKAAEKLAGYQEELDNTLVLSTGGNISVNMFNAGLPEGLSINNVLLNESGGVYQPHLEQFIVYAIVLMVFVALALVFTAWQGGKLRSPFMSAASLLELAAMLLLAFIIFRQAAVPVKAPYSNAIIQPWPYVMLALIAVSWLFNIASYLHTQRTMIYTLCIALCVLSIFPFWLMIVNATRSTVQIQAGMSLIPSHYLQSNWNVISGKNFDVAQGMKNSAIIAFGSTILSVYFSALCAYGLTAYEFKGRKQLFGFIVAIIMIPAQVSNIGFYMFMYQIGWTNSYWPLILPAIASPATVFFMRQYLQANFQVSIVEAARIDGAGEFYTYNRIVMPIMMPALATMGIMGVIGSWNDFLRPLMLFTDVKMSTMPMMVRTLYGDIYRTEYGSIYLGLTMTALPLLIVYFALSKYIIAGVAVGGVKE